MAERRYIPLMDRHQKEPPVSISGCFDPILTSGEIARLNQITDSAARGMAVRTFDPLEEWALDLGKREPKPR